MSFAQLGAVQQLELVRDAPRHQAAQVDARVPHDDAEVVVAQPRRRVFRPDRPQDAGRRMSQQPVAGFVAVVVIHGAGAHHVDEQKPDVRPRLLAGFSQLFVERPPVVQARQAVRVRFALQPPNHRFPAAKRTRPFQHRLQLAGHIRGVVHGADGQRTVHRQRPAFVPDDDRAHTRVRFQGRWQLPAVQHGRFNYQHIDARIAHQAGGFVSRSGALSVDPAQAVQAVAEFARMVHARRGDEHADAAGRRGYGSEGR
ncbi:MAG: hypothetical protein U5Q44_15105 [Dehalococcoidia bacterium]|nr:hypothetical protein [Dehalococcoidia bacterium]